MQSTVSSATQACASARIILLQAKEIFPRESDSSQQNVPEMLEVVCLLLGTAQLLQVIGSDGTGSASASLVQEHDMEILHCFL